MVEIDGLDLLQWEPVRTRNLSTETVSITASRPFLSFKIKRTVKENPASKRPKKAKGCGVDASKAVLFPA